MGDVTRYARILYTFSMSLSSYKKLPSLVSILLHSKLTFFLFFDGSYAQIASFFAEMSLVAIIDIIDTFLVNLYVYLAYD